MAKSIITSTQYEKEFLSVFEKLTTKYQPWEVWRDFVTASACAISNSVDWANFEEREKMYMDIANRGVDMNAISKLFAICVEAFENNREQDFLGNLYMKLNLGNHWTGQFFTPYSVCAMMSKITDVSINTDDDIISVSDCACGAGATLIAFSNEALEKYKKVGKNFQKHVLFIAQDIDFITGMMCYIQLSLLGCAGIIKIADTLRYPYTHKDFPQCWKTPVFYFNGWSPWTLKRLGQLPKEKTCYDISCLNTDSEQVAFNF